MKKILLILCISLWIPIEAICQTTWKNIPDSLTVLTPKEVTTINLIFAEHKKWSNEVPLLNRQINNLEALNHTYVVSDSLKTRQITTYKDKLKTCKMIGGASTIIAFILGLLIK